MGRAPCCDKANVKRGPWSPEEDTTLKNYVEKHGTGGNWIALPQKAGLRRCGKSCRLRWLNYLRPGIKHGGFTEQEDNFICSLYKNIGSRWSVIASHLSGRTDNDVKNYWNTKLKKKLLSPQSNLDPPNNKKNNINNGNSSGCSKQTHDSTSPSLPTGAAPAVKSENYGFGPFSMSADNISLSTLASVDAGTIGFNSHSPMLVPEPASFPVPGRPEPPNYGGRANGYVVSPPQDISAASSCLTAENGVSWSHNGGGGVDAFLMDLGLGPTDLLSVGGYGLLDMIGDAGSIQMGAASLWPSTAGQPQELYQGVMYS